MGLFEREDMSIEEIIQKFQEAVDLGDSPKRGPFGTFIRKEYLMKAIIKLRSSQIVHAKWKYYKKQGIAVCTNCSFERKLDDNFGKAVSCPNCGAKMDEG